MFSGKRPPLELGARVVTAFLSWLAVERDVAAATQNLALSAILFLYKQVLGRELPWLDGMTRAKRPVRLPTALTETEVRRLRSRLDGVKWLTVSLLYGAGLRQCELLMLRVKDMDFAYRQILVRDGKGGKDRVTMLPEGLVPEGRAARWTGWSSHRLFIRRYKSLIFKYGEACLPCLSSILGCEKQQLLPENWRFRSATCCQYLSAPARGGCGCFDQFAVTLYISGLDAIFWKKQRHE